MMLGDALCTVKGKYEARKTLLLVLKQKPMRAWDLEVSGWVGWGVRSTRNTLGL